MKTTRTYRRVTALFLLAVLFSAAFVSCKSDVNMTRRKKSRCNTCPTFSYNQPVNDNTFPIAAI